MSRYAEPANLREFHSLLSKSGDIALGGLARRRRRQRRLLALFGAGMIAFAALLYVYLARWVVRGTDQQYVVHLHCRSCDYDALQRVPVTRSFPLLCPRCQEYACHPLWVCRACDAQFIPASAHSTVCPRCGSVRVGSAALIERESLRPAQAESQALRGNGR